jgi:GNAT superfamily N-acetyltransferase
MFLLDHKVRVRQAELEGRHSQAGAWERDKQWQGKGLGGALLQDAAQRSIRAAKEVSARLLIVHALSPEAEAFYLHYGFTRLPVETPTYALDFIKFANLFAG